MFDEDTAMFDRKFNTGGKVQVNRGGKAKGTKVSRRARDEMFDNTFDQDDESMFDEDTAMFDRKFNTGGKVQVNRGGKAKGTKVSRRARDEIVGVDDESDDR